MRDFSTEQLRLAVSKHVLAMRTIDLLNLMNLRECGKLSSQNMFAHRKSYLLCTEVSHFVRNLI